MGSEVSVEQRGQIAIIAIDNPPVNLLHPKVAAQIADAVVRLATDDSLAGRVLFWWSDDEPKLLAWGDRGYKAASAFSLSRAD